MKQQQQSKAGAFFHDISFVLTRRRIFTVISLWTRLSRVDAHAVTPAGHRPDAGLTHDVTTALARWAADLICSDLVREFTWRVSLAN